MTQWQLVVTCTCQLPYLQGRGSQTIWQHVPEGSNRQLTIVEPHSQCKVYIICYLALLANSPTLHKAAKTGFVSSNNPLLELVYKWFTPSTALENFTDQTQFFHSISLVSVHHNTFLGARVSLWSSAYQHTHWQLSNMIFWNFILDNSKKNASGISIFIFIVQFQQPLHVNTICSFSVHLKPNSLNIYWNKKNF